MFDKKNFAKELVNAFNLSNYFYDSTNANFTVENGRIVGLFERNVDIEKYFAAMKKEIINHHFGNEDTASEFFNLKFFPFNIDEKHCTYDKNRGVKKLVVDASPEVIFNLKFHLAIAFWKDVGGLMATRLQKIGGITEKDAFQYVRGSTRLRKADMHSYLYAIPLDDEEFQELYVSIFESTLQECGLSGSVFFDSKGNELYIKDVTSVNVVKSIAKYTAEQVALDFRTSGQEESKVKNYKDALGDLVFELTKAKKGEGIVIDAYDYDIFTDKNRGQDGNYFALVPTSKSDGQFTPLSTKDVSKINAAFSKKGIGNILTNITGQTENTQHSEEPVYGISNKQLALLISELMKSPIEYNERAQLFEYTVPLIQHQREEALNSDAAALPTEDKEQSQHLVTSNKQEILDSDTKALLSKCATSHHLAVQATVQRSNSTGSDSISSSGSDSTRSSIRKVGGLRSVSSATSDLSELVRNGNNLAVKNGNVMSTSAHSQHSQSSVDSGIGSTFHISQLDAHKPTLQSMQYVATNLEPLLQQSTILNGATKPPLPSVAESGEYNSSISSHTSSNGSLSGKPQTNMSITPKPANKTSKEKPEDLSSSTSIRSSLKNLNVFKHARGVNTYKSDQREKSSCIIL